MDPQPITLSALQHYLFCPRQYALIHIDGLWAENRLTAEGNLLHTGVDTPGYRSRRTPDSEVSMAGVRVVRALALRHRALGLIGKADTVEFPQTECGMAIGPPRPVEHKRGRPKRHDADRVQICAQALCLEDMTGQSVPEGDLFYHAVHRRECVPFDDDLRARTLDCIEAVRRMMLGNRTPPAKFGPKCRNCSLKDLCLPKGTGPSRNPSLYLKRSLFTSLSASTESPG